MVDIFKAENITPTPVKRPISPAVGIPESIAGGGLQGILNMLVGAQNIYRRLPAPIQRGITRGVMPFTPPLPQAVQGLLQRPAQPYTFAQRMPYPAAAEVAGVISPALTPLPEVKGLAGLAGLAERGIPKLAAKVSERGLTGAGYGALFGAERPEAKLTLPTMIGAGAGIAAGPIGRIAGAVGKRLIPLGREIRPYISNKISDIMNRLKGGESKETLNRTVFDRAARYYDELLGHSNDLQNHPIGADNYAYVHPSNSVHSNYTELHDIWGRLGLRDYNRSPYDNSIDTEINKANKALDQYRGTEGLKKGKEDLINRLEDYKKVRLNNFSDADTLKRDINTAIASTPRINATPLDRALRESLHNIKEGLRGTVKETSSINPELSKAWLAADQKFKNQVVPFRNIGKTVSPFYKNYKTGGENVDNFVKSYIKPGQSDLLENFTKILPDDETRQLAAAEHFSGTEEDPEKFIKKYNALNEHQRATLLPEHKGELDQLSNLYNKNKALFKKPQVSLFQKPIGLMGLAGTAAGGIAMGHPAIGAAAAAEPFAAQGLARLLAASPAIRQRYMSGLLRPGGQGLGAIGRGLLRGGLAGYLTPSIYQQQGQSTGQ